MAAALQRTVTFYDDELIAIQEPRSSAIYVPLTRLCENLGIQRYRQVQRIREHPVLQRGLETLTIDSGSGLQEAQCLRIDMIPLWLSGVNANRVKPEIRDKLIRYQTEVADVLWQAFKHDILPTAQPSTMMPADPSGAALAYEIATAVQHLARQQMELEQRLQGFDERYGGRIDAMARFMRDFVGSTDRRLSTLELYLNPQEQITEAQANELALAVKAVGHALSSPDRSRTGYGQVYAEMYRRYRITSYKNLPQGKFEEVMAWLHQWHQELASSQPSKEEGQTEER
jgi:hypothetical protein